MKYKIVGKNIEVTEAIENAIVSEMESIDKYFKNKELEADVVVRTYPVGQKIEISISMDKDHVLRQEEVADDLYDAIRTATKKMERQVRKFKDRITDNSKKESILSLFSDGKEDVKRSKITKRKEFEDKLMTEEEAILQFELVGHDFYVFTDADTELTKVLYKRKDNEYGVIELER